MGCSVAIVTFFYMLTVISYHSVLDMETMNNAKAAVASVSFFFLFSVVNHTRNLNYPFRTFALLRY